MNDDIDKRIAEMMPRTVALIRSRYGLKEERAAYWANQFLDSIEGHGGLCTNWDVVTNLIEKRLAGYLTEERSRAAAQQSVVQEQSPAKKSWWQLW